MPRSFALLSPFSPLHTTPIPLHYHNIQKEMAYQKERHPRCKLLSLFGGIIENEFSVFHSRTSETRNFPRREVVESP